MAERVRTRLSSGEGRRFGLVTGGAFLALGALLAFKGHLYPALAVGALGSLLVAGGLLFPTRLEGARALWMGLALALSKVTTPLLLGIVYFGVMTPIGLLHRSRQRKSEDRRAESLWVARYARSERRTDLKRQF